MSILNDLYKIAHATNVPDFDDLDEYLDDDLELSKVKSYNYDSIAKQAKDGVMQFPFICTRSLSLETVQMLTKASERNFASLLQVVFNMNQITDTSNPADYIRKFHRNINDSINGPRDAVTFVFNSEIPDAMRRDIMRKVCEGNIVFSDMFEMKTLNEKYMPKDYKMMIALEARGGHGHKGKGKKNATIKKNNYNTSFNVHGGGGSRNNRNDPPKSSFVPTNLFIDSDVRKANEMQPTLMHVRILHERPTSDKSEYVDFIVGVKATIHPIASEDMIDHMVAILQDRGKLFDFIRWTTGEISLFKDLIFNVDAIKDEIKGVRTGKSSKWWTILKQIKAKRKMNHWTMREPILPNASLIVSMEEVDYIKANYGFDILEDETGKKILNALNIISFSVVDTASEVVHTMTDGDSSYTINTFKGLEKDTGNAERQFKDILKAVNKL